MAYFNTEFCDAFAGLFKLLMNGSTLILRENDAPIIAEFNLSDDAFVLIGDGGVGLSAPISTYAINSTSGPRAMLNAELVSPDGNYRVTGLTVDTERANMVLSHKFIEKDQKIIITDLRWRMPYVTSEINYAVEQDLK